MPSLASLLKQRLLCQIFYFRGRDKTFERICALFFKHVTLPMQFSSFSKRKRIGTKKRKKITVKKQNRQKIGPGKIQCCLVPSTNVSQAYGDRLNIYPI